MSTPNFFLVGAPKAGTTSLFHYMEQHPEIGVSAIKEPCYFAPEVPVNPHTDAHRQTWETYIRLFDAAGDRRAIGEGSVAYLASLGAARAIHARVPHAKILMMLRDPADRLFAHYSAARASSVTQAPFADWITEQQRVEAARDRAGTVWGPIWAGRYATHLIRFRDVFSDAQIHVAFFDEFITHPQDVLRAIFLFLGVDADVTVDFSERRNVTTAARWPALAALRQPMGSALRQMLPSGVFERARAMSRKPHRLEPSPRDRDMAIALYRDEITALASATGRDLSAWLEP